jgi:hypothetical protein
LKDTILHIGLEKTGTTSIQHLLFQNRKALLERGVLTASSSISGNDFRFAVSSYSRFRADGLTKQLNIKSDEQLLEFRRATFLKLKSNISENQVSTVLSSSEHFQSRLLSLADIKQLRSSLEEAGCSNFRILVYLRDPLKIAMSHHGMAIKKGIHVTESFYRPEHPRISHIVNHRQTIENWSAVFGEENMDVRLYPEASGSEVLIADFLEAVGIEQSQLDMSKQEVRNVNLSAVALEALNQLNARSDRVRLLAEDRWLFHQLEKSFAGRGLSPTAEIVEVFAERFRDEHAQIAKRWFGSKSPLFVAEFKPVTQPNAEELKRVAGQIDRLVSQAMLRRRVLAPVRRLRRLLTPKRSA